MERLTNHFDYCKMIDCKHYDAELFKQGKCKFFDNSIEHCHEKRMNDKLREYEDLEEQGKLLKLHFGLGEKVYEIQEDADGSFCVVARKCSTTILLYILNEKFGKTIFLTKEEAEAALAEMKTH